MATLTVRNVEDDLLARTAETAKRNNRSLSAEVRALMAEADREQRFEKLLAEMHEFVERNPLKLADGRTMQDILREERDSW